MTSSRKVGSSSCGLRLVEWRNASRQAWKPWFGRSLLDATTLLAVAAAISCASRKERPSSRTSESASSVMVMVFYTVELAVITAIPSALTWKPMATADWVPLLGIGFLAQLGQYCFLEAYRSADASILAPIGYLSIIFVTAVGYFAFNEVPERRVIIGVCIILSALIGAA